MPLLAAAILTASLLMPASGVAGASVNARHPRAEIRGTLTQPDALGCGSRASTGCDEHPFAVTAPAGAWVTITLPAVDDPTMLARVRTAAGRAVANAGQPLVYGYDSGLDPTSGRLTFRHLANGRVDYVLGVSTSNPLVVAQPWPYVATVSLAGNAWDASHDCKQFEPQVVPPVPADTTKRLRLSVLVVTTPALLAEVRRDSAVIVADYAKINIAVRLTVRAADLPASGDSQVTFGYLRSRFGGERPSGYDIVYAASDNFPGGVADCIGGVQFPERAFALGEVHYTAQGADVPGNQVKMGTIAAHEIGHLLGAQHHFSNCAEGEPEAATAGDPGPCTIMSPLALTANGEWSALETAYVRWFAEHYAKG